MFKLTKAQKDALHERFADILCDYAITECPRCYYQIDSPASEAEDALVAAVEEIIETE